MSYEVRQRTNGVHFIEFKDEQGTRKRASLGTKDARAAERLGREKYLEYFSKDESQTPARRAKTGGLTLGEAFDRMKQGKWHPDRASSWQTLWSDASILLRFFGDVDLRDITAIRLQEFADRCKQDDLKPGTIKKRLSRMRTVLLKASNSWINPNTGRPYIPFVPEFPEGIETPRARKKELTEEDERRVFEYCDQQRTQSDRGQQWWLFKQFLMWQIDTGMRKGETLGKTMDDIVGDSVMLYDGETKNDDGREVPLTTRLQKAVAIFRSMEIKGRLFAGLNSGKVFEMWSEVRNQLDLKDITIHDLRHTRGQRLADAGVPIEVIADLLGHRDISITARVYTFRKSEALRRWTDHADAEAPPLREVS